MMYKLNVTNLATVSVVFTLFAFYSIASISDLLNISNGLLTWGYRGGVIILSIFFYFLFMSNKKKYFVNWIDSGVIVLLLCFLTIYLFAILRSIGSYENFTMREIDYILWIICIGLIPSLIFMNINDINIKLFIMLSTCFLLITIILTPINYFHMLINGEDVNTRIQSYSVNPIAYGQAAASLAVISFCAVRENIFKRLYLFLFIVSFCAGLFSGSRGALLSLLVVLCLFIIINFKARYLVRVLTVFFLSIPTVIFLIEKYEVTIFDTFVNAGSKSDLSTNIRYDSYIGALEQFNRNFIFGDHIEDRITGYYPHNIILEVLMSTGIIGFIFFIIPMLYLIVKALFFFKTDGLKLVTGCLFIQYFIGAMVSGSIFSNNVLWYMVVALIFSKFYLNKDNLMSNSVKSI